MPVTARAWVESRARIQQQFPTKVPTGSEQPFTRLLDARSIELLVYQVREVDEYLERRRRLGSRRGGPTAPTDEDEDGEKDHGTSEDPRGWRGKPKTKPKAKTAAGRGETA